MKTLRALVRTPLLTAAAVFCLALGIGATTAIFTAVDAALLRPLPFPAPERLVSVFRTTPFFVDGPFSAPTYTDLRRATTRLSQLAATTSGTALLQADGRSIRASVVRASDNYFGMLGARPLLGRLFTAGAAEAGTPPLVLSEELWRERFGGDPSVIGRTVRLDGEVREVAAVLPHGFRVPHSGRMISGDVWVPLVITPQRAAMRHSNYLRLQGRLAQGATLAAAGDELHRLMDGIIEQEPSLKGEQLRVVGLQGQARARIRRPLVLLLGAVALVLLIATANVASLLLARGATRGTELAVRTALGASRRRLLAGALAESALLSGAGAAGGLALAWAGIRLIGAMTTSAGLPQLREMTLSLPVLGFAVALAILVTLLCGLAPAWQAQRSAPQDALRSDGRAGASRGQHRFLRGLIVAEVALSLVLLLSAGLVMRGFSSLIGQDPGFDAASLLTLDVDVPPGRYPDGDAATRFLDPALEALRSLPGVQSAAAINLRPYEGWGWNFGVQYEGQTADDPARLPLVEYRVASPGLFQTMGMTLREGRLLDAHDGVGDDAASVVVVNRALAERDFPGEDPVGKRFFWGGPGHFATIVGVVSDIRNAGPFETARPEAYWTYREASPGATSFPLMVRVDGNPAALAGAVREAILGVDPDAAVSRVRPFDDVIARSVGRPHFFLALLATFASVALVLALAGLYGVMSYSVEQRRREIGIRSALGGTRAHALRLVLRSGGVLLAVGGGLGLAGGYAATRLLRAMLYGVSPLDLSAWAGAPAVLLGAGLAAVLLAGLRAARVDPMVAMRQQ